MNAEDAAHFQEKLEAERVHIEAQLRALQPRHAEDRYKSVVVHIGGSRTSTDMPVIVFHLDREDGGHVHEYASAN